MYSILSDRVTRAPSCARRALPFAATVALIAPVVCVTTLSAQSLKATRPAASAHPPIEVVSQQVQTSHGLASLRLELSDGRSINVDLHNGRAFLNGKDVGEDPAELDESFRALLKDVTDSPSREMARLLTDWSPEPVGAGKTIDRALENAVLGMVSDEADASSAADAASDAAADAAGDGAQSNDTVNRLNERIHELQSMVDDMNDDNSASARIVNRQSYHRGPIQWITTSLAEVFSTLVLYGILFMIAFGIIAFGGRKYIEGVADTARQMTMRSWLVGLAGTFLVIPAFVLGIIALAISIVGIPVLLAWIPLFPLAVVASCVLGFIAVAHAAGESLSEKKLYENDYFQRGNSYYFLLTGLGLLLAPFIASAVLGIAGPWLGFIRGLLTFLGVVAVWAAFTVGFGAVLVSRGGTRPLGKVPTIDPSFVEDLDV